MIIAANLVNILYKIFASFLSLVDDERSCNVRHSHFGLTSTPRLRKIPIFRGEDRMRKRIFIRDIIFSDKPVELLGHIRLRQEEVW